MEHLWGEIVLPEGCKIPSSFSHHAYIDLRSEFEHCTLGL